MTITTTVHGTQDVGFARLISMRDHELATLRNHFHHGDRVLDLGGGAGFQARQMASWGCDVLSIDIANRPASPETFYPVTDYDGHYVPADDATFDIVYSSHTLEHVPHLSEMLEELARVMKPNGRAIHILPSAAWRFWASAAFPVYIAGYLLGKYRLAEDVQSEKRSVAERGRFRAYLRAMRVPFRAHGEYPNAIAELYYFSRARWARVFRRAGFRIVDARPVGIFYTAYKMFHGTLSIAQRRHLARWLGSPTTVFILERR